MGDETPKPKCGHKWRVMKCRVWRCVDIVFMEDNEYHECVREAGHRGYHRCHCFTERSPRDAARKKAPRPPKPLPLLEGGD